MKGCRWSATILKKSVAFKQYMIGINGPKCAKKHSPYLHLPGNSDPTPSVCFSRIRYQARFLWSSPVCLCPLLSQLQRYLADGQDPVVAICLSIRHVVQSDMLFSLPRLYRVVTWVTIAFLSARTSLAILLWPLSSLIKALSPADLSLAGCFFL